MSAKAVDILREWVNYCADKHLSPGFQAKYDEAAKYLGDHVLDGEDFVTNDPAPDYAVHAILVELEHAAKVFRTYQNLERNKNTPVGNYKAETNRLHAERIENVLSDIFDDFEFSLSDSVAGCEPCQGDIYAKVAAEIKKTDNPCAELYSSETSRTIQYNPRDLPDDIPEKLGDYRRASEAAALIAGSFRWSSSSEGFLFWQYVASRLNQISQEAEEADKEK